MLKLSTGNSCVDLVGDAVPDEAPVRELPCRSMDDAIEEPREDNMSDKLSPESPFLGLSRPRRFLKASRAEIKKSDLIQPHDTNGEHYNFLYPGEILK